MLAFVTDEDLRGPIIHGMKRHHPEVDLVRAVDIGLAGATDDGVLDWAASHHRIVVSHDVSTMIDAADRRVAAGLKMAGLIVARQSLATRTAIKQLRFVAEVCGVDEMENATFWLPI